MKLNKVYAVGVGPGSPKYITSVVKDVISQCDVVIGYDYTNKIIEEFIKEKRIVTVTMMNQEEVYQKVASEGNHTILVPFTGDVNFSESEVVDRLIEIFDEVEIIPGISSIQVAAARARIPIDKSKIITMHVSTSIEENLLENQLDRNKNFPDVYYIILDEYPSNESLKKYSFPFISIILVLPVEEKSESFKEY